MRIATWNVNSLKVRLGRVEEWLAYAHPDVLCLQETKLADATFPHLAFSALGYESVHHGDGRWNGVAIVSRVGIDDVVTGFAGPGDPDSETRIITRSLWRGPDDQRVCAQRTEPRLRPVPVQAGVAGKAPSPSRRAGRSRRPGGGVWRLQHRSRRPRRLGSQAFVGATHVSEPERAALRHLEDWGLVDAFRARYPEERLFSYWDYRAGDFHEHRGMRIDLVLVSRPLAEQVTWALVDRNARKGKLPSDHAPVLVDVDGPAGDSTP